MLPECPLNTDEVELHVDDAVIRVIRRLTYNLPHEVSAFIPRVEIRRRRYANGQLAWEEEVILNSLTVVHSPQRPSTGAKLSATGPGSEATAAPAAGKPADYGIARENPTGPGGNPGASAPARLRMHYA
ncbi:MAG: hypothetical protein PWQ18_235 [Clostridia bacterium]|nr:hypothetical protein [Clostridia bacterium]